MPRPGKEVRDQELAEYRAKETTRAIAPAAERPYLRPGTAQRRANARPGQPGTQARPHPASRPVQRQSSATGIQSGRTRLSRVSAARTLRLETIHMNSNAPAGFRLLFLGSLGAPVCAVVNFQATYPYVPMLNMTVADIYGIEWEVAPTSHVLRATVENTAVWFRGWASDVAVNADPEIDPNNAVIFPNVMIVQATDNSFLEDLSLDLQSAQAILRQLAPTGQNSLYAPRGLMAQGTGQFPGDLAQQVQIQRRSHRGSTIGRSPQIYRDLPDSVATGNERHFVPDGLVGANMPSATVRAGLDRNFGLWGMERRLHSQQGFRAAMDNVPDFRPGEDPWMEDDADGGGGGGFL